MQMSKNINNGVSKDPPTCSFSKLNCTIHCLIIWLVFVGDITRALIGQLSLNCRALFSRMLTSRLRACARTIGCKVITSAALVLLFFLYFCLPYNKQLNNVDLSVVTGKYQTYRSVNTARPQFEIFYRNDLTLGY